jgi:ABC-type sugar transport system ATPase subunit
MTMGDMIVVMNQGRIEQVGTPQQVYETPKTRFVAGFVGSPPMNFFRGRLIGEGDRVTIETGSARFVLPKSLVSGVPGTARGIDLGVRPQHVALTEGRPDGALPVTVYAVERLGKENVVVVQDEARNTFRALTVPSDKIAIGDRVFLSADVSKAFVFPCSD